MTILGNIGAFLLAIGILITLHEMGHFLVARLFGFPTPVFSIGFGPKIASRRVGDVEFRISWIPLGGYVKILGMGYDESSIVQGEKPILRGARWQRALILCAGPGMNILLAWVLIAAVYVAGVDIPSYLAQPAVAEYVAPGSPAERAGIQRGDRILAVDGREIASWEALHRAIAVIGGDIVEMRIRRGESEFTRSVEVERTGEYSLGYIGVAPSTRPRVERVLPGGPADSAGLRPGDVIVSVDGEEVIYPRFAAVISSRPGERVILGIEREGAKLEIPVDLLDSDGRGIMKIQYGMADMTLANVRYPLLESLRISARDNLSDATLVMKLLQRLLRGRGSIRQMSGPIDIARFSGEALRSGASTFFNYLGRISLQLGVFNLLPLPILDGGYLLILLIEGVRRRELSMKLKERVLTVGFYFLIALMIAVLYIDFVRNVF